MDYDFDAFLSAVKYLDKEDILATAYKKHKFLDKPSSMYTLEARMELQNGVQSLLRWLETGQRAAGVSDANFAKLKPVCESLIRKGQLGPEAIALFE
jgi:hypothetical protein